MSQILVHLLQLVSKGVVDGEGRDWVVNLLRVGPLVHVLVLEVRSNFFLVSRTVVILAQRSRLVVGCFASLLPCGDFNSFVFNHYN